MFNGYYKALYLNTSSSNAIFNKIKTNKCSTHDYERHPTRSIYENCLQLQVTSASAHKVSRFDVMQQSFIFCIRSCIGEFCRRKFSESFFEHFANKIEVRFDISKSCTSIKWRGKLQPLNF